MATRTLQQLIDGVRQVANVQNNQFVTDAELTDRINEAVKELYDLVLSVYEHYYEDAFSFTLIGGQSGNSVSLAALSFYKDNTCEWNPGTSNMRVVARLASNIERDAANGRVYEIKGTPPVLYVYSPEQSAGNYRLLYTPDAPVLATNTPGPQVDLDATLSKWYEYVQIRAAIEVHRKRQKLSEAMELAGNEGNPQPGTLAYIKRNVLTLARNRQEQPQQVPLGRRRSSFWNWDDSN